MATRIIGIDLGAYSVKVVIAQPGFRQAVITDVIERPVPSGDEPHTVRAARVLGDIVRHHKLDADTHYAAVAGDKLFTHVLEFGFRSLRRPDLEKAVGAELEGILPLDLEDMVYGFESLPDEVAAAAEPEPHTPVPGGPQPLRPGTNPPLRAGTSPPMRASTSPAVRGLTTQRDFTAVGDGVTPAPGTAVARGRVAEPTEGMRVLACATETDRARNLLEILGEHAVEPRALLAAPAPYARIAEHLASSAGHSVAGSARPLAIIDIGHERTDVCVIAAGRVAYFRTIARAGRHVTEAISRAWHMDKAEAQQAKHTDGFIASRAEPAQSEQWLRIHEVVLTELEPLAKEIKRTLQSCRAKTGFTVREALLVGGGSQLRGISSFLAEKLRIRAARLSDEDARNILGDKLATTGTSVDVACMAVGVVFEGGTGRPRFDLRQGELAYKADLSFLRQKATSLAAAVLVVMAFVALSGYAQLYKERAHEANLATRLALETTEAFGEQLSASEVFARVQGKTESQRSPLPKLTAYDILLEMNGKLPARDKVTLDVQSLDITQGKVTFRATTKTSADIDAIEEALKTVDCFESITRGNTTTRPDGGREFSFTIKNNCM